MVAAKPRDTVFEPRHKRLIIPRQLTKSSMPTKRMWTDVCGLPTRTTTFQITILQRIDPKEQLTRSTATGALPLSASAWMQRLHSFESHPDRRRLFPKASLLSCKKSSTSNASSLSSTRFSTMKAAVMAPSSCNQCLALLIWHPTSSDFTTNDSSGIQQSRSRASTTDMARTGQTINCLQTTTPWLCSTTFR